MRPVHSRMAHAVQYGIVLGGFLGAGRCLAQTAGLRFQRLDGEAGLSHNSVYAITQDREGFLWFGTADGLNRYDGYEFLVFRHNPADSGSLPNNLILDLLPEEDGRLWVTTPDGLSRFDPTTERFERFTLPGARAVFDLFQAADGSVWAGSDAGVFRHDPAADRFAAVWPAPGSIPPVRVYGIRQDPAGDLWFLAGQRGDWRLVRTRAGAAVEELRVVGDWRQAHFDDFHIDGSGRLWLVGDGPAALDRTRGLAHSPPGGDPVASAAWATVQGRDGALWIGSADGVYRIPSGGTRGRLEILDRDRSGYIFNFVRALFEDRAGTLWVGTHGGVYRADPHSKPFHHLAGDPGNPHALSSRAVSAIYEREGAIWVGTMGAGLNRVDLADGSVRRYRHAPGDPRSLPNDLVWSLLGDDTGAIWVGTGCGLARLDPATGLFRRYGLSADGECSPLAARARDGRGRLWLTGHPWLIRFDPATGTAERFTPGATEGLPALTESIVVQDDSTIWVGTLPAGLLRLDPRSGHFTRYPLMQADGRRMESEAVWGLHRAGDGALWLGTGSGLSRFDPATAGFRHYFEHDGLPGSVVYGIVEDKRGNLWLGTNRGLSRFDPAAARPAFRNFGAADGLGNTEFNRHAAFRGDDGVLYFGGLDGLTWFRPAAIADNPEVPPMAITRIETARREGPRRHNPRGLRGLALSYRDYSLELEFAALSFTNPSQNRYAFRLDGLDPDWVQAGSRRFARYTDLPPGRYVFRVRGSNNDGVWNDAGIALPLRIAPPFWQTWAFRAALVLAAAALVWALWRARLGRLLEIERLRLRIAGDLHDDLSSNLVGIALLGERLHQSPGIGDTERGQLSRISNTARRMVQDLRDIVWLVDPARDHFEDLQHKMRDLAATMLPGVEWDVRAETPRAARMGLAFRRQLYLIYKELLHNVARHAGASTVSIELSQVDRGRLLLRITDDGAGFDPGTGAAGFGLRSMQNRVEQLGGELAVTSAQGQGTRVEVLVPIP